MKFLNLLLLPHGTERRIQLTFSRILTENVEHYVMGDMNCDLLSSDNIYARALLNVTDIYGLKQLTDEHARITPSAD